MREYLEKNYSPEAVSSRDGTLILAIKALLEVVQSGSKFMELAVMERGKPLEVINGVNSWFEFSTVHQNADDADYKIFVLYVISIINFFYYSF